MQRETNSRVENNTPALSRLIVSSCKNIKRNHKHLSLQTRADIDEFSMEKHNQVSERSCSSSAPYKKYHVINVKSSKFLNNFQEMFLRPSVRSVPFLSRRGSVDSTLGRHDDESQVDLRNRVRLFNDKTLSSAKKNSEVFHAGNQCGAHDAQSRALACVNGSYGYPSPSAICCVREREPNLLFYLSEYTPTPNYSFQAKCEDQDLMSTDYVGICEGETSSTKSATRERATSEEREKNFKITCTSEKRQEPKSDEAAEKKRKGQLEESNDARNVVDERASYWERRRRNNASAKKSRDARRARELQTQIKVAFLEKENMRMLAELRAVRQENVYLRRVLSAKF